MWTAQTLGEWVEYWRSRRCHGWHDTLCTLQCEDYTLCRDAYMTIIETLDDKFKEREE
jgi:hypothetical protein